MAKNNQGLQERINLIRNMNIVEEYVPIFSDFMKNSEEISADFPWKFLSKIQVLEDVIKNIIIAVTTKKNISLNGDSFINALCILFLSEFLSLPVIFEISTEKDFLNDLKSPAILWVTPQLDVDWNEHRDLFSREKNQRNEKCIIIKTFSTNDEDFEDNFFSIELPPMHQLT